jgi:ornithine cyclodeaminase/alanine dehydrogenase
MLSESDLRAVLTMREVIDAVEYGFRALGRGEAKVPERSRLDVPASHGVLLQMPAYANLNGAAALGTKIVSVFEENFRRGIEIVQSVYLLLDSETGVPLSLMDGRFITAIRTAATSAVATKHMSAPGSKRLAVFGAGIQASFHIDAMVEVEEVEQVMITSRSADKARALADHVRTTQDLRCELVSTEEAAATANLICTCTSSGVPLFDGGLLNEATHINAVGAFTPSTRELDTETVRRSRVIIDDQSAAGREAGEISIYRRNNNADHVKGTLAEVVSGKLKGAPPGNNSVQIMRACDRDLVGGLPSRAVDRGIRISLRCRIKRPWSIH